MGRFSSKVVLVTGAASGIGEATARRFGQEGAKLVLADLNEDGLRKVAGEIGAEDTLVHAADLSNADRCQELITAAINKFGRLDVLVNNAGKDHLGKVDEGDLKDFSVVIETDLYGVFYMTRFALPHLRQSRGCIVNVSSVSGLGGDWNHSFYCAAKGAVTNFTRAVALEERCPGERGQSVLGLHALHRRHAGPAGARRQVRRAHPDGPRRQARRHHRRHRLPGERGCAFHHRREPAGRWRPLGLQRAARAELGGAHDVPGPGRSGRVRRRRAGGRRASRRARRG
jgi:meso-butanediol dehydrogenase/(S,S)-butanediol dehydrogenase/diacetyl reductase